MLGENGRKHHRRTGEVVLLHAHAHAVKEVLQDTSEAAALRYDSIRPHRGARIIDFTTINLDTYVIQTLQRNIFLLILQLKTELDNITDTTMWRGCTADGP